MSAVLIHLNSKKSNDRPSSSVKSKASNEIQDANRTASNSKQNYDSRIPDANKQSSKNGSNTGNLGSKDRKDPSKKTT